MKLTKEQEREIIKFLLKTSVPRILEERKNERKAS